MRLDAVAFGLDGDCAKRADYSALFPQPRSTAIRAYWSLAARMLTVNAPILLVSPLQAVAAGLAIARASVDYDWVFEPVALQAALAAG